MTYSASSSSSSRVYAVPLEDVVRVVTLPRAAFGANLAKVTGVLKGEGFVSITANAAETTCVGSSDNILAHFAHTSSSSSSSPDVSISHTWRVFRVDGDGECTSDDGGATLTETGVVENVSERLGKAGISCYYTASIEADFVLVSEADFSRACDILVERRDSLSYSDVFLPEDTVEIARHLGSDEEHDHPLGSASTLDAGPFSLTHLEEGKTLQSLVKKRSCPEIGIFSFGASSSPPSPSAASFSTMASHSSTDSPTFETLALPEIQPMHFDPVSIPSRRSRRASSSAATAMLSTLTPRQISPIATPPSTIRGVVVHPSQLSMVKLQPSSSRRHDTALDGCVLFLNDVASDDLLSLAHGCASFFSVVKDEGAFSVTGDPNLMGKRFDEVTDETLKEARQAREEQHAEEEQAQRAAIEGSGVGGGSSRAHRRTVSCPPTAGIIGPSDPTWPGNKFDLSAWDTSFGIGHDSESQVSGTILRCLQIRLIPDEGFRKSGILRKYSSLLSNNSIPMVYHSTASFANILVPKKDLALARQILEQA